MGGEFRGDVTSTLPSVTADTHSQTFPVCLQRRVMRGRTSGTQFVMAIIQLLSTHQSRKQKQHRHLVLDLYLSTRWNVASESLNGKTSPR